MGILVKCGMSLQRLRENVAALVSRMAATTISRHFPDGLSLEPFQARITVHVNSTPLQGQTSDDFPDIS